jgi:hypothetical protein
MLLASCGHSGAGTGGPGDAGTRGILLDCDVPQASVFVDDYYLKHAAAWREKPMPLAPGMHRVELTADGYYPYYGEVAVPTAGFPRLTVRMRKVID